MGKERHCTAGGMLWRRDVRNAGDVGKRAPALPGGVREGVTWEVTVELCLEG